jgi:hypothetical protein
MYNKQSTRTNCMTNPTLCLTVTASIAAHFFAFEQHNLPVHVIAAYYICLFSSLTNHAFSSKVLQWFDRSCVAMCAVLDLYLIVKTKSVLSGFILLLAVGAYFVAKQTNKTIYHVIAHALITYSHVCLLENIHQQDGLLN